MALVDKAKNTKKMFNKAYSMRSRFLATVIFAMLAVTIFIGGISIYEVDNYIQRETANFVRLTCDNEGTQINNSFSDMEKSVKIMKSYVLDFFSKWEDFENRDLQNQVIINAEEMFIDVAKHTGGAVAYYFRFDPSISDSKTGIFYSKLNGDDEYTSLEPTDLTLYEKDDVERVGWYWQPYEAGQPVWMKPYYNQNNGILMISYVEPMFFEGRFVGIVGMDFDYKVLANRVHDIKVYENGFAHLELDGKVIHDESSTFDPYIEKEPEYYLRVTKDLTNGMTLVLSASYGDIRQIRYEIAFKILFAVLALSALFMALTIFAVQKIVDPLRKLTDASEKLSNGDYNVEMIESDTYEIKLLSAAFENMAVHLREREELLHLSANRDSLTGLRNTTSYKAWSAKFGEEIENKNAKFGVAVFDVNDLKVANDRYGHDVGNKLIVTAARIISDTFKRSPVFRIGGDEFLVVLQNRDLEDCNELFVEFDSQCANTVIEIGNTKFPISIAGGFAVYDSTKDLSFADVFKRADEAMYENKRKKKKAPAQI